MWGEDGTALSCCIVRNTRLAHPDNNGVAIALRPAAVPWEMQPSLGGEPVVATSDVADVVATDDAADAVADLTEKTSNLDIAEPETAAQPSASQDGAISPQGNPVVPWPGNTKKKPLRNKNAVKKSSRPGSGRNNKRAGIVMGMTAEEYSSRNLYLRALPVDTTDESLYEMCIVCVSPLPSLTDPRPSLSAHCLSVQTLLAAVQQHVNGRDSRVFTNAHLV